MSAMTLHTKILPAKILTAALLSALPGAALAHPHVFIDAGLALDYDPAGALTQVTVEWAYDDFYSLLIIEDLGLDPDGDGILTPDEQAALQGFDADWEEGFDGRLYLDVDGAPVALQAPRHLTTRYEDGRLISAHVRPLAQPLDGAQPLRLRVYDPEYYVQFAIPAPPVIRGADCAVDQRVGDPFAAADAYARAVAEGLEDTDGAMTAEMLIVDIGAAGADEIRLSCGTAP
ncbi:DUF1007 family protein [Paracoccus liaowanqingii]|uniref:DUF1007 family protein n=1 Tax=Paracoccus liaowanqingii TaxID=2560053 RepID=A0A4Z1BZA7_9RHOB|nr:DUF1007 family protein [Paracoccus liaowanqingii]TGN36494.1 DUF1007 family protein [Paracoccus liaowanqingii]